MKYIKPLLNITGNGANGTMISQLLGPYDVFGLLMELTAGTASIDKITSLQVWIDGIMRRTYTGAQLNAILVQFHATTYNTTSNPVLYISFEKLGVKPRKYRDHGLLRVGGNDVLASNNGAKVSEVRITFAGATTPSITLSQVCRPIAASTPRPAFASILPAKITFTGASEQLILTSLEYGSSISQTLESLRIIKGSGNVTNLRMLLNSFEVYNSSANGQVLLNTMGNTLVQGSYFTQSFYGMQDGFPEGLNLSGYQSGDQKFQIYATSDTAETLDCLIEMFGQLPTA